MEFILIKLILSTIAMLMVYNIQEKIQNGQKTEPTINIDQGCVASVDTSKYIQHTGKCKLPVNDINDTNVCRLHFSEMTFPGTHNSGADKLISSPTSYATACIFLNQNLNITQQLELGIRALDLDVTEKNGELRMMHGCRKPICATGVTLECVLNDIMRFLLQKRDQTILVIRILNYSHEYSDMTSLITKILQTIKSTLGQRILNRYTDPTINSTLTDQRPVFFYIHRELWESIKKVKSPELKELADYLRPAQTPETWNGTHDKKLLDCNHKKAVIEYLDEKKDILKNYWWIPTYIDWFRSININFSLICNEDMAKRCNARITDAGDVAQHLLENYSRTINILQTDYTGQETIDEAKKINEKNIKNFVTSRTFGRIKTGIPKSNQTSNYPFIKDKDNSKATYELEIAGKYPV